MARENSDVHFSGGGDGGGGLPVVRHWRRTKNSRAKNMKIARGYATRMHPNGAGILFNIAANRDFKITMAKLWIYYERCFESAIHFPNYYRRGVRKGRDCDRIDTAATVVTRWPNRMLTRSRYSHLITNLFASHTCQLFLSWVHD